MDNLVALRFLTVAVITIATVAAILAIAYMKFPGNAAVVFFAVVIGGGVIFFVQKKEKAARFEIYYSTVQEFGKPLSYNKNSAAFERNGTRFDVDFPQGENSLFFKVNFFIPHLKEKFSIQNKSLGTKHYDDCYWLQDDSPLPPEFLLQSRNVAFLLDFLKNRAVYDEITNYNASMWSGISFLFEDGSFEMIWTPPVSEQISGFDRAVRSAVVFHDALKKIAEKH